MLLSTLVSLALTCYILDWDDHRLNDDHERVHVVCAVNAAIGVVLAVLSALYVLHDSSTKKFFLMLCSCLLVGVASAYVLAGSTFVLTQYGHYGSYENVILTGLDSGHDGDHDHGHGHNDGSSDGSGSGSGVGSMAFHTGGAVATALATQPLLDDWQLPARAVAAVMAARRRRRWWRQLRGSPRHGLHCACRSGVGCVVPHSSGGWEGVVSPKSVDAEVA